MTPFAIPRIHKSLCLSCFKAHYNSPDHTRACPKCGMRKIQFNGRLLQRAKRRAA